MALKDLTDRQAVLDALKEYDRLKRPGFLKKYGFGAADEYILVHDGRYYDSKAIAGVAHLFQTGFLPNDDFKGGLQGAVRRLEALEFEVLAQRRGSFMLVWSPTEWPWDEEERQAIKQSLSTGVPGSGTLPFNSRKHSIQSGDRLFLFLMDGKQRGLIASGHAASEIRFGRQRPSSPSGSAARIQIAWDMLLDPTEVLPLEAVQRAVPGFQRPQGGNTKLDGLQTLALDALWEDYAEEVSLSPFENDATSTEVKSSYSYGFTKRRNHQRQFRNLLLKTYEPECAVCGFDQVEILEAAHLVPDSQGGPSSVENGRLLCPNHHRALDTSLFHFRGGKPTWISPESEFLAPVRPTH